MKEKNLKVIMLGKLVPFCDWIAGVGEYANEESICTRLGNTIARARSSNSGDGAANKSNEPEQVRKEERKEENKEDQKEQQQEQQQQVQPQAHNNQQQVEQCDVCIPNNCAEEGDALCGGSWVTLDPQHFE